MQDETITTDYLARYDAAPEEQKFVLIRWSFWNQYNTFHNQPFDIISSEKRKQIAYNAPCHWSA